MKLRDLLPVAALSRFRLHVRQVVEGVLAGLHTSTFRGQSLEFSQHREYAFGDELRHIDWKVYGRSDRFVVKQYQDETNVRAHVLVDASGSMQYTSGNHLNKLEYAACLAGAVTCLLLRQEDAAGLGIFDEKLRSWLPPSHRTAHLSLVLGQLEAMKAGGDTDIEGVVKSFGRYIKKRGLVILISDLMSNPDGVISALKYFRHHRHEVIVLHVLDPQELSFTMQGDHCLVHLETKEELSVDCEALRNEYRTIMRDVIETYKRGFRNAGIEYRLMTTDIPLETALARFLRERG
jgi:uncharacterized protein (DUF58 family)